MNKIAYETEDLVRHTALQIKLHCALKIFENL